MNDTQTTVYGRHRHRLSGRTSLPQGFGNQHLHYYEDTTSFNDGHVHEYSGWTGPPIPYLMETITINFPGKPFMTMDTFITIGV
ncbi:YmaF family protein [Brevibacillus choshinensis]|uniref:YmaF family protein n=1 Tax=Brevibacillus choshinensis TaxID=54911 RepID=UPI002E1BF5C4|nr:YmaF family protein [Brevibacillus choshinensis]